MTSESSKVGSDISKMLMQDPYLPVYTTVIQTLHDRFVDTYTKLARVKDYWGFVVSPGGLWYREWSPDVQGARLIGDFNNWNRDSHVMNRVANGVWEIYIPDDPVSGKCCIPHATRVKISMFRNGDWFDRVPSRITRAELDSETMEYYNGIFWNPPNPYTWRCSNRPRTPGSLRIYEAHIGISSSEPKIASYNEFRMSTLPRIVALGYNCIQFMAIQEHSYYGSFGYQVTSFYASSSRYGTPEELKELIDEAHMLGVIVLLDIVHSHASTNVIDGLNMFDGTEGLYFKPGPEGHHTLWGSRLFDYKCDNVQEFLLSNLTYFVDTFQFDGFRFDGVTSMLYKHHGVNYSFTSDYSEYFGTGLDEDAVVFLRLVNHVLHTMYPDHMVTIAEDVSGMPLLCHPACEGGIGFDYRLSMGIPDMWIRLIKHTPIEEWSMTDIAWNLTNMRAYEKSISYAESHDQALVGDKSIAFRLMGSEMYTQMSLIETPHVSNVIQNGISVHKMIRLLTFSLASNGGYLNFMGNEFGHPEWLDFPRPGNSYSHHYARRQYNLVDNENLRYKFMNAFDVDMIKTLDINHEVLSSAPAYITRIHESDKILVFERNSLLFVFNFHTSKSYTNYHIQLNSNRKYSSCKVILNTDSELYGGLNSYNTSFNIDGGISFGIPVLTAIVLEREE